jgi:hypothetical protein
MVLYDTVTNRVDHLAVAYLLEAKEGGGGWRVGLFYCLLLSAWYFMIQSQMGWTILIDVSLEDEERRRWKERGPLLLFTSLCMVLYDTVACNGVEHLATTSKV